MVLLRAEFVQQHEAARTQRAALPTSTLDRHLEAAGLHREGLLPYDASRYRLRESLTSVLDLGQPLERFHGAIPGFSPRRDAHSAVLKVN